MKTLLDCLFVALSGAVGSVLSEAITTDEQREAFETIIRLRAAIFVQKTAALFF